jgi:hypothetical protein
MPSLKIILLCIASAVVYGILHDQVTARVCVEYFTIGHQPIFHTQSPTLLAFGWGTLATWWVGLILGVYAALACRAGKWPKLDAGQLVRPIACLLSVMAIASLLAGITGYRLAAAGGLELPEPLGSRVPKAHHYYFFADSQAHLAAYGVGLAGGLTLCAFAILERRRMARASAVASRRDLAVVVLLRWTARAIGIPLFGLAALLAFGDGVPNPLKASPQENLLGTGVLLLLTGVIVAWHWEGAGALLILGSLALYAAAIERLLLDIVLIPWLVLGAMCLVCWWRRVVGHAPRA